jgi:prepilin-type N-terminal cleavage/methylation domain-containing protein
MKRFSIINRQPVLALLSSLLDLLLRICRGNYFAPYSFAYAKLKMGTGKQNSRGSSIINPTGFTFIEISVVLSIIAIILGLSIISYKHARIKSKELRCVNNLKLLAVALENYRNDWDDAFPPYLTILHPKYITKRDIFICPIDNTRGQQGSRPKWMSQFPNANLDGPAGNIIPCSYLYEFNGYECDWLGQPGVTWYTAKMDQVRDYGERVPIIRCFWHLPVNSPNLGKPVFDILFDFSFHKGTCGWEYEYEDVPNP